jgi:hypothetical protein
MHEMVAQISQARKQHDFNHMMTQAMIEQLGVFQQPTGMGCVRASEVDNDEADKNA